MAIRARRDPSEQALIMARLRRTRATVSGFLNVRKPEGVTSHHCVAVVRKIFNTTEVGHAGTLDPMATGVLVMALGRATKFLQHLKSDKEYRGVVRFGLTTSTDDITGDVLSERAVPWITEQVVQTQLRSFVGSIDQIPPKVSALKRDGKRLYELARENAVFEVKPRRVEIHGIDLLEFIAGNFPEANIRVACGAGTYIRSIARECGEAIEIPRELVAGVAMDEGPTNAEGQSCAGGTLVSLERTRSGAFSIDQSITFEEIRALMESGDSPVHPVEVAVEHLPLVSLSPASVNQWIRGGEVDVWPALVRSSLDGPDLAPLANNIHVRVYDQKDEFLGVSHVEEILPNGRFILRRRSFAVDVAALLAK